MECLAKPDSIQYMCTITVYNMKRANSLILNFLNKIATRYYCQLIECKNSNLREGFQIRF